jgi:tetratricopeptide (TPR) repeat protein
VDEALVALEEAVREGDSANILGEQSFRVAALGEAHLRAGRLEDAAKYSVRALELARRHTEPGFEAHALRVAAEISLNQGRHAEARASYAEALARANQLGMAPLVARCHLGLALLPVNRGEPDGPLEHLARAAEMFDALGMTLWRTRVDAVRIPRVG